MRKTLDQPWFWYPRTFTQWGRDRNNNKCALPASPRWRMWLWWKWWVR